MTRLTDTFARKPIFMPYYPLGYPTLEISVDVIEALAQNGADLIEVGLSFSDPLADGPVIQRATQIALEQGMTVAKALRAIEELRRRGVTIPLIFMGYYNPLLAYGLPRLAQEAEAAGVDGFIVPDLPPEEAGEFESVLAVETGIATAMLRGASPHGVPLPLIRMVAPTTPPERLQTILREAQGFIYLVSLTGVTGLRTTLAEGLAELVARVRAYTPLPICVGFGVGTPEQARAVGQVADGVIVGTACVKTIGESERPVETAREWGMQFKEAL